MCTVTRPQLLHAQGHLACKRWLCNAHAGYNHSHVKCRLCAKVGLSVMWTLMINPFALNIHMLRVHPRQVELSMTTVWIRLCICKKPCIHVWCLVWPGNALEPLRATSQQDLAGQSAGAHHEALVNAVWPCVVQIMLLLAHGTGSARLQSRLRTYRPACTCASHELRPT